MITPTLRIIFFTWAKEAEVHAHPLCSRASGVKVMDGRLASMGGGSQTSGGPMDQIGCPVRRVS